jgi:hypothetical protein
MLPIRACRSSISKLSPCFRTSYQALQALDFAPIVEFARIALGSRFLPLAETLSRVVPDSNRGMIYEFAIHKACTTLCAGTQGAVRVVLPAIRPSCEELSLSDRHEVVTSPAT